MRPADVRGLLGRPTRCSADTAGAGPSRDEATKPEVVSQPNGAARFGVLDCSLKYERRNASAGELAQNCLAFSHAVHV
jgi:hypothetical protein